MSAAYAIFRETMIRKYGFCNWQCEEAFMAGVKAAEKRIHPAPVVATKQIDPVELMKIAEEVEAVGSVSAVERELEQ